MQTPKPITTASTITAGDPVCSIQKNGKANSIWNAMPNITTRRGPIRSAMVPMPRALTASTAAAISTAFSARLRGRPSVRVM